MMQSKIISTWQQGWCPQFQLKTGTEVTLLLLELQKWVVNFKLLIHFYIVAYIWSLYFFLSGVIGIVEMKLTQTCQVHYIGACVNFIFSCTFLHCCIALEVPFLVFWCNSNDRNGIDPNLAYQLKTMATQKQTWWGLVYNYALDYMHLTTL